MNGLIIMPLKQNQGGTDLDHDHNTIEPSDFPNGHCQNDHFDHYHNSNTILSSSAQN